MPMKKIIGILMVLLCVCNISVSADLGDITEKLLEYYKIEVTDDVSGTGRLQNRRNIKNPELVSAAIKSGVIVAKNGLVNESGDDYTPVIDGLIKRYINSNYHRFVSGKLVELARSQHIIFDDTTFFVTLNQKKSDLNYTDVYTCITDRSNKALFVWKAGEIVQPALYKVKLYWLEGDEFVASQVYRKGFGDWIKESKEGELYTLDASAVSVSEDFVTENLDKYVYVFADNYGGNIVVKGISQ